MPQYSKFAYTSITVELIHLFPAFEDFTIEMMGSKSVVYYDELSAAIDETSTSNPNEVIIHLTTTGFLLLQIDNEKFRRIQDLVELKRSWRLAEKFGEKSNQPISFQINSAYWSFLEVNPEDSSQLRIGLD